ncbi:hypothetical protein GSbR_18210 [Geobacter sp. SVR]|nr:nuclear transport factor 2 family protein [Geobacter sp. SVR]BCS55040.1 hypothetical protein GSVR_33480 [Geobacter sp. SVR]GCF85221.1 hypothetical protein GSbR_18210 [Geobacter sp. SVR]
MDMKSEESKAFVLKAFDTLFNKRNYVKAAEFWSETYIQHSAHIEPGRDGLFNLIRSLPDTLRYENARILAEGDYVMLHGRFSGHGRPRAWIAADIVRLEGGRLAEHWDVLQDEATKDESKSGLPMFGTSFAEPVEESRLKTRNISTLLPRNLHDVFGENDPVRRRAAIDEIFTDDCMFCDPMGGVYRGRGEIDRVAGAIRATHRERLGGAG